MPKTVKFAQAIRQTNQLERRYVKALEESYLNSLLAISDEAERTFAKYQVDGKWDRDTMNKMTVVDKKRITRIEALETQINKELTALNRGKQQQLSAHLTDVYQANYVDAGNTLARMAGVDKSFALVDRQAVYRSVLRPMAKIGLEDNARAVRANIRREINQSIVQGESIDNMAARIAKRLEQNKNNAVRIARTETTGIMGEAREDMFRDAEAMGINIKKVWQATSHGNTRDSHAALDGVAIGVDELFSNGLEYPGDQQGDVSEVANCRCTMIAEIQDWGGEVLSIRKTVTEE